MFCWLYLCHYVRRFWFNVKSAITDDWDSMNPMLLQVVRDHFLRMSNLSWIHVWPCYTRPLSTWHRILGNQQTCLYSFQWWIYWQHTSVQFSCSLVSDALWPHGLQHARLPCPLPNSCPLSQWCHPTISLSVVPFSSCLQPLPASGSFTVSQFFISGGQSFGASASASVLPMNSQEWFPLGWTGWISLQSKGLTPQKHQFFGAQLSLWSHPHIIAWLLEKP